MRGLLAFGVVIWLATLAPAPALTIRNDHGGNLGEYADRFAAITHSGQRVAIAGPCNSACTLVLGLPHDRLCVTPRARFGFHRAYEIDARGRPLRDSPSGTAYLMNSYPPNVRAWLAAHGGLTRTIKYASGAALGLRSCR
jgi:hypothetical protein